MKGALLLAGMWFAVSVTAAPEKDIAQRLASAKNRDEVESLRREHAELRVLRLACRLELSEARVPLHCYSVLARQKSEATPLGQTQLQALDRRCRQAARRFQLPALDISLNDLSARCRQEVMQARRIQNYRQRDNSIGPEIE